MMKNLTANQLRGNIRIFQEWLIPAWGEGKAAKNARKSIAAWKGELLRRGLKYRKTRLNGLVEKCIEMQRKKGDK